MAIPANLTLIREDFRVPRLLKDIKADMAAVPTDYVMVVGLQDLVDVLEPLTGDAHYLATHVGTRRAIRYSRPVLAYDPLLLTQFNYVGSPILHKSLVPLFPEAAMEPKHTVLLRAQSQGASISLVSGGHTVIEPWPRPQLSGINSHFRTPFDPAAVMEVVPTVQVQELNGRPFYSWKNSTARSIRAFCHNCSLEFVGKLSALNVGIELADSLDIPRMQAANAEYVAWFDGIEETAYEDTLNQLMIALEFPGVAVASPRVISNFTPASYHMPAFWLTGGIYSGFSPFAWITRTRELGSSVPVSGYTTGHAILRKVL